MIKDDQIYIGNKFIGDINFESFEIINITYDNDVEYVVLKDSKSKKIHVTMDRFKNLLLSEDWRKNEC